ncbi:hypothetical protein ACFL6C_02870 [Myxococcota bacterium]
MRSQIAEDDQTDQRTKKEEQTMKTLACDMCDQRFSAEAFDGWFAQMKTHYMSDHSDVMAANANKSKEEGMKWMADMKAKFEAQ